MTTLGFFPTFKDFESLAFFQRQTIVKKIFSGKIMFFTFIEKSSIDIIYFISEFYIHITHNLRI